MTLDCLEWNRESEKIRNWKRSALKYQLGLNMVVDIYRKLDLDLINEKNKRIDSIMNLWLYGADAETTTNVSVRTFLV